MPVLPDANGWQEAALFILHIEVVPVLPGLFDLEPGCTTHCQDGTVVKFYFPATDKCMYVVEVDCEAVMATKNARVIYSANHIIHGAMLPFAALREKYPHVPLILLDVKNIIDIQRCRFKTVFD